MVFIFKELEFKFSSSSAWEIGKIFGIGYEGVANILNAVGINPNIAISNLNLYIFDSVVFLIKYFYISDERLKYMLRQRLNSFIEIRLRRGLRVLKGLPIRGQHTHRNSKQNRYHIRRNEI